LASGAFSSNLGKMLGINIPVQPVEGMMWSTKPLNKRLINSVIFFASAKKFWDENDSKLIENGYPPGITFLSNNK